MSYAKRDDHLRNMGFQSYKEYLGSPLYCRIRHRVLRRSGGLCEVCRKNPSQQVHHRSYSQNVLLGNDMESLVAVCKACHAEAEFNGKGGKLRHAAANSKMNHMARSGGNVLVGMCNLCKKYETPDGRICRRCQRGADKRLGVHFTDAVALIRQLERVIGAACFDDDGICIQCMGLGTGIGERCHVCDAWQAIGKFEASITPLERTGATAR